MPPSKLVDESCLLSVVAVLSDVLSESSALSTVTTSNVVLSALPEVSMDWRSTVFCLEGKGAAAAALERSNFFIV